MSITQFYGRFDSEITHCVAILENGNGVYMAISEYPNITSSTRIATFGQHCCTVVKAGLSVTNRMRGQLVTTNT